LEIEGAWPVQYCRGPHGATDKQRRLGGEGAQGCGPAEAGLHRGVEEAEHHVAVAS